MHLRKVTLFPEKYPTRHYYPFNQEVLHKTKDLFFSSAITFFIGENGTGKSTLLRAIVKRCGIHIWQPEERSRYKVNPYEEKLYQFLEVEWLKKAVPGLFFSSELFKFFSESLDDWASVDPGILKYFGGKSLMTLSHGQALMSYFSSCFQREGLFLLDEPETALSPRRQIELVNLLKKTTRTGHAQFIIASHSPILLACPDARVFCFDRVPLKEVQYEETEHYKLYRDFFNDKKRFI